MPASEPILPSNGAPSEGRPSAGAFAGTVTGVKNENGVQTVEVRFSQGRIRVEAEGDFRAGEKVRLAFPGNGSVLVEKTSPTPVPGDPGVSYRLPQNMPVLRDLRVFEEAVAKWLAAGASGGLPGNPAEAMRPTFPHLLMKTAETPGGPEFLRRAVAANPEMARVLMDSLEEVKGEAGPKARLIELLRATLRLQGTGTETRNEIRPGRGLGRSGATPDTVMFQTTLRASSMGGYPPMDTGGEARVGFGRIMEKRLESEIGDLPRRQGGVETSLTPPARTRYPGIGTPPAGHVSGTGPLFRYTLDMGGRSMEVFSPQTRESGEFTGFELERMGSRLVARFSDPAAALPAELRTALAAAPGPLRQGMLLASHHLKEFREEPYFGKLVRDFGEVLAQSGRLPNPPPDGRPESVPDQKELDGLLRLFVAFPRDTERPERQARTWGDAGRDPRAMLDLLKSLRPETDVSLLRTGTALRLAAEGRAPEAAEALMASAAKAGETPETTAAWLRKLLPEAFDHADLLVSAKEVPQFGAAGKEQEAARFMLQALVGAFPREDQMAEGRPGQFYFYQGQEWRNLQVTWEKGGGGAEAGKRGAKPPLQVRVETSARNMGRVEVAVSWEPSKGATLDFRNQSRDVRDLFSGSLPELEKSLSLLGFRVTAWTYALLPDDAPEFPDAAARPLSSAEGAGLNLFG